MPIEQSGGLARFAAAPNLPRPLPDELLYSLIARSAIYVGEWSPKQLLEVLYRHRGTLAVPDLPSSLARLAEVCGAWGLTVEELAHRHTLLPYYTAFFQPPDRARVLEAMLQGRGHLHVRLGICAGGVARTRYFRLCPACTREDLARHGETYWRRTHHLPGVLVCAEHGEPLLETSVPFRPFGRHEHIGAHPRLLAHARPAVPGLAKCEAAHLIAQRSAALLVPTEELPQTDYRAVLRTLGFVGRRGGSARLQEASCAVIPQALLAAMFASAMADGRMCWLDLARRKPRRVLHPLKHVVMRVVLEAASKRAAAASTPVARSRSASVLRVQVDRSRLPEQAIALAAKGLTTRAIALELGVAWKTANRLLRPPSPTRLSRLPDATTAADRAAWTALRSASPAATRTELRRIARALYARLYRADRAWLLAQPCPRYPRRPVTRIDWESRDRELADRTAVLIEEIRARTPTVRVSRHRVLGELQVRSLLALRGAKLPRTRALLAERCEGVEAFQLRRLALLLSKRLSGDWIDDVRSVLLVLGAGGSGRGRDEHGGD